MRLSTADVPRQERFELWYDVTTNSHVPMAIDSDHREDFRATTELHDLGPVQISQLSYPALTARRTAAHIRRSDPELLQVSLSRSGRQVSQWAGGETMAHQGDLIIYDPSRPGTVINSGPISHLVLQVPRTLLHERGPGIDSLLNTPLPARRGLG